MKKLLLILLIPLLLMAFRTGGYRTGATASGTQTIDITTAGADTLLYLKHYGSRTTDYGIVIDMDTSANTAANAVGIDMSGSNAFDASSDYWIYLNATNSWMGNGVLEATTMYPGAIYSNNYFGSAMSGGWAAKIYFDADFLFSWTGADVGDVIFRDGNLDVANDNFFQIQDSAGTVQYQIGNDGSPTQETYVIRKHVALSGAADNSATAFFTITTTDETGSADGGMYSVKVHTTVGEATAASGAVNTASVSLIAHWSRIMASAGTGANSAVVEISETTTADEGSGAISAVTLTIAETSEFVQTVSIQVNTSGGTADAFAIVELVYSDFTTAPVIE